MTSEPLLAEILKGVREVKDVQQGQAVTLAQNTASLQEHMRRTTALEERFAPVERHVIMWAGVGKAIGVIGALASLLYAAVRLLRGG